MSNENTPNPPVLKNSHKQPDGSYKDEVALWPTKEGDKALLSGFVTIDGQKTQVRAFINDTDKDGNKLKSPYLSLTTNTAGEGQPPQWKNVAFGNAMNQRSDGKPVYFDQVIFNVAGSDKSFNAYAGKGCTEDFHAKLGFTSPQVARPAKEDAPAPAEEEEHAGPKP